MNGGARGAGRPESRAPRWRLADERCELRAEETMEYVRRFHRHEPGGHQCTSVVAKHVRAPVHINYSCILTVHPEVVDGQPGTLVIESFMVDIPEGNTEDDICYFVKNMLKCNLKSLADVSEERLAACSGHD